ncbi:hypothetical protein T440DRAFT_80667 [Plenodomus tracheiphilus IPT5]|uniref:Uncharacterized protein n=1 Tax=Plenodomus tracheiphilus IPT5 TaxID=1408161 RepID=A0A6A7B5P7_9PLEO|nr:hypothetical protein T440DRAFT_80667 [Plenodomus tracheiphilus IPT5]
MKPFHPYMPVAIYAAIPSVPAIPLTVGCWIHYVMAAIPPACCHPLYRGMESLGGMSVT